MMQRVRPLGFVWGALLSLGGWLGSAAAQEPPAPPAPLQPPPPLSAEQWAEFDAYIESAVVAFGVPGAAVALIQDGQIAYTGTYGVRGVDDPVAVNEETRFMIGSVTKSMTTTLAAELVSRGHLAWDDPVTEYLPAFELANPEWTPLVTLRDLFRHTSGVPRSDLLLFIDRPEPRALLETVSGLPALTAPGERFEYQNQLFAVGGYAMVRAAGAPLRGPALARAYVRRLARRLFEPLGMKRATADFDLAVSDENHAWSHTFNPVTSLSNTIPIDFERFVEPLAPAGAVWASVTDLARYFAMHLREGITVDGERAFPAAELLETHTPQIATGDPNATYALGWGRASSGIGELLEHGGGTAGFGTQLLGLPDQDWGLVVLVNDLGPPLVGAITTRLVEIAYGLPPQGDEVALAAEADFEAQLTALAAALGPVAAESVAQFAGRYEHDLVVGQRGEALTVGTAYGELEFRVVPGFDLYICTTSHLFGLPAQFAIDEEGAPSLLIGSSLENGAIVDPLIAERVDEGPPCHREHRHARALQSVELRVLTELQKRMKHRLRPF